jgi:hypothetical protein
MKLMVEVTTKDDKVTTYECVDFPSFSPEFVTLYEDNFVRQFIKMEGIAGIKQWLI